MTTTEEYFRTVNGDAVRVEMMREGNRVVAFTAQGELWDGAGWRSVVRYDTAHGRPHCDVLDWAGRTVEKTWLPAPYDNDYNAALTYAEQEIIANWARYRADYFGRRP